jgi:formiminotetrahydrofolate cyclodeaminase
MDFLDRRVGDLLEEIGARTSAQGGGSVAALVVAMSAGLVEMAARFSQEHWHEAESAAAKARSLREGAAALAQADAEAYQELLAARRLPEEPDGAAREAAVERAVDAATGVPLDVAAIAEDVALLALEAVRHGNQNLHGDSGTAAMLAAAAARAAACLVAINLDERASDGRVERALAHAEAAGGAAARAISR